MWWLCLQPLTMAPKRKHNNSQPSSTAEGTPRKRQKKLLQRKEVVEKMEEIMHLINGSLPEDFVMLSGILKIPRTLVEDIVSSETVETRLATFKDFCQTTLDAIAITLDIGPPAGLTPAEIFNQGRFIHRLVALVHL
jgi:hypothetical protein